MQDTEKRRKLVEFLDRKAFDPVLSTSVDKYSGRQREKFEDVRHSTESEKQRFHDDYRTAVDVKQNYLSDLNSQTARKKNAELKELGLPRLPELKDEFLHLCEELEV
jgi:hypothetical protein